MPTEFERYKNMRERFEIEKEIDEVEKDLKQLEKQQRTYEQWNPNDISSGEDFAPYERGYLDALKFALWDLNDD